jgi:NADPH:quinone reductase
MRAVAVNEYGATPELTELPDPQPGTGQVLIAVEAAGVNPMDRAIAAGFFKDLMPAAFPLILGVDVAGTVESTGQGVSKFAPGDEVFGQLFLPPLGAAGTYAERVAVGEDAVLARIPSGLDPTVAAALPTAGATAQEIVDAVEPLDGKVVLLVGAAGGIGSFATQLAVGAGAEVLAVATSESADRLRDYGASEVIDRHALPVADAVRQRHGDGIDVLIDVASDAEGFAGLASLVRPGGTALTTLYVADVDALASRGVSGVNFQLQPSGAMLERLAEAVVSGRIVAPPITRIGLEDVVAPNGRAATAGKTVITFDKAE